MSRIKRTIAMLLAVILLLGLAPLSGFAGLEWPGFSALFAVKASAEDPPTSGACGENLTWKYDTDTQTLTISGTGPMNDFGTFDLYYGEGNQNRRKLTNAPWFNQQYQTETVVLEPGVTTVGKNAFYGFEILTAVTIPDTVTRIEQAAFYDCKALTELAIPGSVTVIGSQAFTDCKGLTGVVISNGVTEIGSQAFRGCKSLTEVVIPDSVTSIGEKAFYHCFGLQAAVLSNNLNVIPASVFESCAALESITIPDSVTVISESAFSHCKGLKTVVWGDHVAEIGEYAFYCCVSLTNITIPNSVKTINGSAFGDCTGLQFVTLPNGMTAVPRLLLENCSSLTRIEIPDSVTDIGSSAFSGCSGLMSIAIPDSVTSIGNYAFSGCVGLMSIAIPDSVTSIGNSAFSGCTGLTHVTIPGNVTSIGNYAFEGCNGLTSVTVGNGIKSIGYGAFSYCTALESITIPDSVETIGRSAFAHSALTQVTLPDGLLEIAGGAFSYCAALESIIIPDSVTSIGNTAFQTCTGLTSITISSGVTSIGHYAFSGCTELTDVYFNGTKAEWQTIQIGNNNQPLLNARIHYLGEIYTATFVVDGEVYATEKFTATQESIHEPDVPEKPGYTGSWSPYILNEQDITIEAIYKQITYYATIIADGATIAKIPFVYGQKSITLPDVPKKEGHTGAWPTYTLPANDITIEAIYKPNDYAVTFYCDDAVWTSGAIPYGGPVWQPRTPEKEGYTFVGWTPKIPDTMPAEDLTFTAVFEPITYYATFVADGAQVGEAIPFTVLTESITPPAVPEKPGYACAWEAFTLGIGDLTVNAVYTRLPTIQIKNFTATKNVDYKTTLTFTALATDVPDGAEIQWFVNNERAGTGETCKVEKATADYTVQAKLIGSDGSVLAESEIETVKVNTGFFAKLIAFFKGLFGSLPVITQAIKDTL